jgi:NAD(P)-dependent dehydrogenase (short-subunit alcohol dehydrogenase family)
MDDLEGRHVVVTGGTGGLGGAVVDAMLARGATVHVPSREPAAPAGFERADHERVRLAFGVDLTAEASVTRFFEQVPRPWASIHLAGGFAGKPIAEMSLADYEAMLRINAVTCFLACREAVRAMRRGVGGGRIVNVGARAVLRPVGGMAAYIASKAAVAALTQALAEEVREDGILVNAVLPSIIDTPANRAAMPRADHAAWPKPAEIAETIAFLVAPACALTSGALVPVYGRG